MIETLYWWFLVEVIGIAVLPIAFRFFRQLPDRGYAFIKPLGLLLVAYPFWLLTSFGFLSNTRGAVMGVAMVVAGCAWYFGTRENGDPNFQSIGIIPQLRDWLSQNRRYVIAVEAVFTIAFFAWTLFRAYNPEITATEKPMEFSFLNGILQSDRFPPHDPWLAGYAISYYYFGYIIVAVLTQLSGVLPSIAFNLAIALLFAVSATGAYGLAYNLIAGFKSSPSDNRQPNIFFPLFASIFLVLIGNLEGLVESLHSAGLGSANFWGWLDVKQLTEVPITGSFVPTDNWWWWRASRVVHDVVNGGTQEVIDEFPQFSFLLGDMHPHVLALPFTLLALAAALNLLNSQMAVDEAKIKIWNLGIGIWEFSVLPLILGGLFFLNTWDILPYGFILVTCFAVARYRAENAWDRAATGDLVRFTLTLGVLSGLLYFPFYLGFQSQAGGILPVLFVKTRLQQYLIMFGLFVFILGFLIVRVIFERSENASEHFWKIVTSAVPFFGFPVLIALVAVLIVTSVPAVRDSIAAFLPGSTGNPLSDILRAFVVPLAEDPWLFILLASALTAIVYLVRTRILQLDPAIVFVLLIAFTGFLLTYGVEFVYLRDQFATRMNTVFKFYFQAWTLFSVAAGFAVWYLSSRLGGLARAIWFAGFGLVLAASLVYPTLAIPSRADGFRGPATLDGLQYIKNLSRGDYDVIQWLRENAPRDSVIVEAVGDAYSYGNRISMATGLATPLGWTNHENQWRGSSKLFKDDAAGIDREADVRRIYQSNDAQETLTLLAKYDIKFVVVGGYEKSKYGLSSAQLNKFNRILTLAYESGDARIYAR